MGVSFKLVMVACLYTTLTTCEEISELKIETTFMPEDCEEKSKIGQRLSMHYTGTLVVNGKQFDSRQV